MYLASLIAVVTLGQCPAYSAQHIAGHHCGILGQHGAIGWGISESGWVCGWFSNCNSDQRPFYWPAGGVRTEIIFPVAYGPLGQARAQDVSEPGIVVGRIDAQRLPGRRGFKYQNGQVHFLNPPSGDGQSDALAVNSSGVVVGTATGNLLRAVRWSRTTAELLALPLGPNSTAFDINDAGQICGWMGSAPVFDFVAHAFIWTNGVVTDLGLPSGSTATVAQAVNNFGDACGYFIEPHDGEAGFIRRACAWIDGQFIDLGTLPGCVGGVALDINDAREIVGVCTDELSNALAPFVWRDGVMYDLNDLVPPGTPPLTSARGINNTGQITGQGHVPPPNPHSVAFLLTPAPPTIPGNTNCDNPVDVDDLIAVILGWNPQGPVGGDPADVNRDNRIDIWDLLEVILHWG